MECNKTSHWIQKNIPEYQYLFSCCLDSIQESSAYGCDLADGSCNEVKKVTALGFGAERIYFTAPGKTTEDIQRTMGKCRLVANDLEDLDRINQIAQSHHCIGDTIMSMTLFLWNAYRKTASFFLCTLKRHSSSMSSNNGFDNGKADAGTSCFSIS